MQSQTSLVTTYACHDPDGYIFAKQLRELFGGVSDMTLHRWIKDEQLQFPQPVYFNTRRYWRRRDVLDWFAMQGKRNASQQLQE